MSQRYTDMDRMRDAVSLSNGVDPFENPFSKAGFNLTKQGELLRSDPEKARALMKAAGHDPKSFGLGED